MSDASNLSLRLTTEDDIPALQRLYEQAEEIFSDLQGRPAQPDQAARDFFQALGTRGRYQFAVLAGDRIVELADCKLSDELEGQAHIGIVLLPPPWDDPALIALVVRILYRWLSAEFGVSRLTASLPAHQARLLAAWQEMGFTFTGEQYRQEMGNRATRFLTMAYDPLGDRP